MRAIACVALLCQADGGSGTGSTLSASAWVTCAGENQYCAFNGTRAVRYGADQRFVYGIFSGGLPCSSKVLGDPAVGIAKSCGYASIASSTSRASGSESAGPSGTNPPIVINASLSARAGHVIGLQGVDFGEWPRVHFDGVPSAPLEIVNRVGTIWLAVQIPADAPKAIVLRVSNATGTSARIVLNAARPMHLDASRIVPGGTFRIFGRALSSAGTSPAVTVDGLVATVDTTRSDEYLLRVTAPNALRAGANAVVLVDNGNGTGPVALERTVAVAAGDGSDPFDLGVGWTSAFSALARTIVDVQTDMRLARRAACNGIDDDAGAIRSAIDLAASIGGGLVRLPAGRCRLAHGIVLKPRVVVQGAGKDATEVVYESEFPVAGTNLDLAGLRDLTLANAGSSTEGMLIKDSTRIVLQHLRLRMGTSRQMALTGNRDIVVTGTDFIQAGSISEQGPYNFSDTGGLVFEGNTTHWVNGAPTFGRLHDSYVHANRFTRDAQAQRASGVVHSLTIDFAHRIAVIGNTFDVINGPITNRQRNDGETILTEGGGAARTENLGRVASATTNTMSDPTNAIDTDPFATGAIPENYGVAIVSGRGAGQMRHVVAASAGTLTVDRAWDVVPEAGSHYAAFVFGLERSLIKDNLLAHNPRGIWLYQSAIRDVDVVGNQIQEGGGIFLRAYQDLQKKIFTPIWNVVIAENRIVNTTGAWLSNSNAVFVNADAQAFGIAMQGITMRSNDLTTHRPNLEIATEDYAGVEGFMTMMRVEHYGRDEASNTPRVLGSILAGNGCTNCDVAVRVGAGAGGTTIVNTRLVNSPPLPSESASPSPSERATDTLIR